ncbi:Fc.00g062730.m01.CDS01 [Cosmosporella sp. VM-42]
MAIASEKPWMHWNEDDNVSIHDLDLYDPPVYKGWTYVRHKEEGWIRCAAVKGRLCQLGPTETLTEIFNIPCSTCSGEDPCVRRSRPLNVYNEGHAEATGEDLTNLELAVDGYFDELLKIQQGWFDRLLKQSPSLSADTHGVLSGSLRCVEQPARHIFLPENIAYHPHGVHRYECIQDCVTSQRPWDSNISRGGRFSEAYRVRADEPAEWFLHSHDLQEQGSLDGIINDMGTLSPIVELVMNKAHSIDMMERIHDRVQLLISMGPNELDSEPEAISPNEWEQQMRGRSWLAEQLAFYPNHDPGLSGKFCELLLNKHILTVLNPWLSAKDAPQGWHAINWGRAAQQDVRDMVATWYAQYSSPDKQTPTIRRAFQEAEKRREHQFLVMDRNRQRVRQHTLRLYEWTDPVIQRHEITPTAALRMEEQCAVCFDKFQEYPEAPRACLVTATPCCKKPLHFKCFKQWVCRRELALCPYCNQDMATNMKPVRPEREELSEIPAGIFFLPKDELINDIYASDDAGAEYLSELIPAARTRNETGEIEDPWFLNLLKYRRVRVLMSQRFWAAVQSRVQADIWMNAIHQAADDFNQEAQEDGNN